MATQRVRQEAVSTSPSTAQRRWRRLGIIVGAAAVGGLIVGLAARETSPVGHFTSASAKNRFMAAYNEALRDLPRPDRVLDIRTNSGVVRLYRFSGEATQQVPIVLLPGRSSASPVWADNLPSLLQQAPLYTVDLLGEPGMSIQDRPISSSADQARWLHEVLLQLPEPQLDLLGLSIGGWTAMNLALYQPEKIRAVMLLDPVFVFAPISIEAMVRSIPATVRWLPKTWRDSFNSWTANRAPVQDVPIAQMIEAGMQGYALKLPAPQQINEQQLTSLDRPVLAIMAGQSRMQDSQVGAAVARRALRAANVIIYPNASHAINGEYPELIAANVRAFRSGI
jgi:pimeloyl-ACP methyl ester carboxylesterase